MSKIKVAWPGAWPGILILLLLVCFITYYPGSHGGFIYDDYSNIVFNQDINITSVQGEELLRAAFSSFSGFLRRPVSMLSFALNVVFTGYDPYAMKLTNILLHLLNGVLIYVFTVQLLAVLNGSESGSQTGRKSGLISLAVAGAWLLHPINLISVLYIVQRMNLLSAFFTLLGLIAYMAGRKRTITGQGGILYLLFSITICGSLAALSKENGLLIYLYFLVIEFVFLGFGAGNRRIKAVVTGFYLLMAFAMTGGLLYLTVINPGILLDGYQGRNFDLFERLLTEARALWFYLYLILIPNLSLMSLHHDEMMISTGLLNPVTTLPALLGLVGVAIAAIMLRKRMPVYAFGLLFFLAGHSMESSILPLEPVFEYRNYLPSYGIIFVMFYLLLGQPMSRNISGFVKTAAVVLICLFAFTTYVRARQWGDPLMLRFHELEHNPESARITYEVGRFYASALDTGTVTNREEIYRKAEYYFNRTLVLQPNNIQALAGLVILSSSNGKPVNPARADDLIAYLGHQPLNYTEIDTFNALLNCKGSQECDLEDAYINAMIDTVVKNSHIHEQTAAVLNYNLSLYFLNYMQNVNLARKYAENTVARQPDNQNARKFLEYILSIQNGMTNQNK